MLIITASTVNYTASNMKQNCLSIAWENSIGIYRVQRPSWQQLNPSTYSQFQAFSVFHYLLEAIHFRLSCKGVLQWQFDIDMRKYSWSWCLCSIVSKLNCDFRSVLRLYKDTGWLWKKWHFRHYVRYSTEIVQMRKSFNDFFLPNRGNFSTKHRKKSRQYWSILPTSFFPLQHS